MCANPAAVRLRAQAVTEDVEIASQVVRSESSNLRSSFEYPSTDQGSASLEQMHAGEAPWALDTVWDPVASGRAKSTLSAVSFNGNRPRGENETGSVSRNAVAGPSRKYEPPSEKNATAGPSRRPARTIASLVRAVATPLTPQIPVASSPLAALVARHAQPRTPIRTPVQMATVSTSAGPPRTIESMLDDGRHGGVAVLGPPPSPSVARERKKARDDLFRNVDGVQGEGLYPMYNGESSRVRRLVAQASWLDPENGNALMQFLWM